MNKIVEELDTAVARVRQAGVANELSKLYAATLGGFAPVALGMFPDAADRPHGAYQDLTPASLPDEAAEQARVAARKRHVSSARACPSIIC